MNNATTLWVIEDNDYLRSSLTTCFDGFEDLHCTGSFSNCEAALTALNHTEAPKILLIDIGLPGMNGIEGIQTFKKRIPDIEPLVLTVSDDSDKVFEAIQAGASGYLLKTASLAEIVDGCRKVAAGGASLNEDIARMVLNSMRIKSPRIRSKQAPSAKVLSDRELEILQLVAEGHPAKRIGEMLGITLNTVRFHNKKIYRKLHVQSQTKALYEARKRGLI